MECLVGYTGFVGSNILNKHYFDKLFNSKNIEEAYNTNPDLMVFCGLPAEKYMANKFPIEDQKKIEEACNNIKKINPKKIVLISSADVYCTMNKDEDFYLDGKNNEPYGKNRLMLEGFVKNNFEDYLIIRLPSLFGKNIKKNFIYDIKNYIPKKLSESKYKELNNNNYLDNYYKMIDNGFYELQSIKSDEKNKLKGYFKSVNFSSLNFTDSRSEFQFFNLEYLWKYIEIALKNNIKVLNITSEPISAHEIYEYIFHEDFVNEIREDYPKYNLKSKYSYLFGGKNGYMIKKEEVLKELKEFIKEPQYKLSLCNIAFTQENEEEILELLKSLKYDGLEIAPTVICQDNPYDNIDKAEEYIKRIKNQYCIEISSIQSIWYKINKNIFNEQERDFLLEYTKKAIDYAKNINCHNLCFGCPKNRFMGKDNNKEEVIDFFREIGNYAIMQNVIFSIEPILQEYGNNFLTNFEETLEFVKKINSEGVKINLDIGTLIGNNEDIQIINENFEYINHIHISEPFLVNIKKRDIHKKLKDILINNDYNKYISIEMNNKNSIEELKNSIYYIKKVLGKNE